MRWTDMHIAATATALPAAEPTAGAVADGRYDPAECEVNGYTSICVADRPAADLAADAARAAVARAGVGSADIAVVLHAGVYHQGQDYWTPAAYVQHRSVGGRAPAIDVKQASNGGLAAIGLAMAYLAAGPGPSAALVTTSDTFGGPAFDRYRSDKWVVFGDGATAAVVSRTGGVARILASGTDADPTLEELYRGGDLTYRAAPFAGPVDLRTRKAAFVAREGFESVAARTAAGLTSAVGTALDDAGVTLDDVALCVLPNVGRAVMQWEFLDVLKIDLDRTTWAWGAGVGHIGAGDQIAGLDHLLTTGRLRPGDLVLLAGSGMGFNWNALLLQIEEPAG